MRNTKYIKAMLKHSALYAIAMALVCGTKAWGDDFKQLSGLQIKRLVEGTIVTDDVHYTDYFNTDGSYEGVFMNKRIGGHWKIGNGQLCVVRAREPPGLRRNLAVRRQAATPQSGTVKCKGRNLRPAKITQPKKRLQPTREIRRCVSQPHLFLRPVRLSSSSRRPLSLL